MSTIDTPSNTSHNIDMSSKVSYRSVGESFGATVTFAPIRPTHARRHHCLDHLCWSLLFPWRKPLLHAHITAYGDGDEEEGMDFDLSARQGESIRRQVLEKLSAHSQANGWSTSDVGKIVVMCPELDDEPHRPGCWVLDALQDFLGERKRIRTQHCNRLEWQEFVVEHRSGKMEKLQQLCTGTGLNRWRRPGVSDQKFQPIIEHEAQGDWIFEGKEQ